MDVVPDYVIERVLRDAPAGVGVVPCSTPVVAFGNFRTAEVATLGLNPSRVEFLDRAGAELLGPTRRLATRTSLGRRIDETLDEDDAIRVVADCDRYFQRNPYMSWFGQLESVVNAVDASYLTADGGACHLDVAQWATDPVWGKLRTDERQRLLADGLTFLREQLRSHRIEVLLINGAGATRPLADDLRHVHRLELDSCTVITGSLDDVRVVAWSTNLQSSFGVSNHFRRRLALLVNELIAFQ